ncbi:glycosyl hydrolase 115 family protein [Mucilaginibacter auburnensis]|uniref:Glycosyl hydrolase family 115 (Putative glucuronidase) n=1 Tax=Mucilaginibacter auburnensis TaxID=1457233 RepID=A0A2H9VUS5_9SPHI|nr:glycosyl hydrolase 115 family protein [Mucilaginibacter auburnensis]PJJ84583.1 glycosyl hydrolase family 115 (putative glucuronidase) [Mucilaginibacter auburnensis]
MLKITFRAWSFACLLFASAITQAQNLTKNTLSLLPQYIQTNAVSGAFKISANGNTSPILVDGNDWKGVIRAANDLGDDIGKVTTVPGKVIQQSQPVTGAIIIGTIGKSKLIDNLIAAKKIDVSAVKGKWESFIVQTLGNNLVIAGSDKRGTIYGIYDVSEKIGVSPWYWWADAPVKKSNALYVKTGRYIQPSPKVKYRGIFINDESPSFTGWARANFGGVNSKAYVHMFELLLRLKANYLWPAMWGNTFNEDDPMSPVLADEYGIVMGTSHHEPMMRAQKEYTNRKNEVGPWDFTTNASGLQKFWADGLERNKNYDNLITMGMRGDGDVAMGKGDDKENIQTLKNVVSAQRDIIKKVYDKDPSEVPQLWAIFTEVQRYYDAGLNVPDDITLLFCDNNWGYIRRTGPINERKRKGGLGMYYHIDMNGGPWNDRWVNTTTVPKLREQFNLAYQTGIDRIWIVNVGDLKPKEMPIDFIMRYAWNPDAISANQTDDYMTDWAAGIFGKTYAKEIADIVSKYSKYNLMRKAEVQDPKIFSYVNFNEAERVFKLWKDLTARAEQLEKRIPAEAKDAYYQLVLYPTKASAGVAEIYLAAGRNNLYAKQGRVSANDLAKRAQELFELDKQLSLRYNDSISNKKWKNMMSDVHIGYKQWSMPKENSLPALSEVAPLPKPALGVAVEGSTDAWPGTDTKAELPQFDALDKQRYYIDIFNRGTGAFKFTANANQPWIKISKLNSGVVEKDERLYVEIDWKLAPKGKASGLIEITGGDAKVLVQVNTLNSEAPKTKQPYFGGFSGEFSIPAEKYNANISGKNARWTFLPNLGRAEGNMGIQPVTAPSATAADAPRLDYNIFLAKAGTTKVCLGILPTQDVNPARGLRIAVAIDNAEPVIIDARKGYVDTFNEYTKENLANSLVLKPLPPLGTPYALSGRRQQRRSEIFDNLRWLDVDIDVKDTGMHTIKVYMVDPEIVLERIVVNPNDKYPSYMGAPSIQHKATLGK